MGFDLIECGLKSKRLAIWPARHYGINHVGDGEHLGFGQNGVATQTLRITRSVKPFVML